MQKQNIPFEEVYDLFAVRIIIDTDVTMERADCWRVYTMITELYKPNQERTRDWITYPKSNGYESLHTTVMSNIGRWVEVQIRSQRMDEIAERGYAAHWKYKDSDNQSDRKIEDWLAKIREILDNPEANAIDFLDQFRLNFFSEEVSVFTPTGDVRSLPSGATALDFAFDLHTDIGKRCLGVKVNNRLVPLNYALKMGDQIEIITSKKQHPTEEWLVYVKTAKAKSKIKDELKEIKRKYILEGKSIIDKKTAEYSFPVNNDVLYRIAHFLKHENPTELQYALGKGSNNPNDVREAIEFIISTEKKHQKNVVLSDEEAQLYYQAKRPDLILFEDKLEMEYSFAKCCNAIPGDHIVGFITMGDEIKIHRTNCGNYQQLASKYGSRTVNARWANSQLKAATSFPVGLKITGIDGLGIVSNITNIISKELKVNMESLSIQAKAGAFEGFIILQVFDTSHLEKLMSQLKQITGIELVQRYEV
jgi:GTP pyrophosphokinase